MRKHSHEVRTPNPVTIEAMKNARDGVGLTEYASFEELVAALDRPPSRVSTRKMRR